MAVSFTYNATYTNCAYIYRTTGGGVTFSANLAGAVFDYFPDTAVNNDAIYFGVSGFASSSNLKINVGTPLVGGTGVWEYFAGSPINAWRPMHDLTDPSNGLTVAGAHTLVFPIQVGNYSTTVNGVTAFSWIRFRLTGGTVTEGGANQTSTPQLSNGFLTVSGGTDAVPGTFTEVYDWLVANAPEVSCSHPTPSVFIFHNVSFNITSRLKTNKEIIFIGNGANMTTNFSYLESGTKVGTDGWKDQSYFFWCTRSGGSTITTSANTKIYGGVWSVCGATQDGVTYPVADTYLGTNLGEIIGLSVDNRGGYFGPAISGATRNTHWGELITTSFPINYPTKMRISNPSAYIWGIYNQGGTINGVEYALPTVHVIRFNQGAGLPININFDDCSPALPGQGSAPRGVGTTSGTLTSNILGLLYYDASAGTFTDYTTQANNDTANDVPLSGDVGDMYYFRTQTSTSYQLAMAITLTAQSNDYEYVWEYYESGTWKQVTTMWDYTENFTKSGELWIGHNLALVPINGVNGLWVRARIVTKGTATPTMTRAKTGIQTGVGDWRVYERYSITLTVEDEAGNKLENATVTVKDVFNNETELTTDVDGLTTQTMFVANTMRFDPAEGAINGYILRTSSSPYTITVEKAGYETAILPLVLDKKMVLTIPLKTQITKLEDDNGNVFDRVDKTNSGTTSLRRKLVRV